MKAPDENVTTPIPMNVSARMYHARGIGFDVDATSSARLGRCESS